MVNLTECRSAPRSACTISVVMLVCSITYLRHDPFATTLRSQYDIGQAKLLKLARPNPKRGSGLSVLNRWAGAEGKFLCRRAFRAFNLDLAWRFHSLFDWARHGSALFHDRGLD